MALAKRNQDNTAATATPAFEDDNVINNELDGQAPAANEGGTNEGATEAPAQAAATEQAQAEPAKAADPAPAQEKHSTSTAVAPAPVKSGLAVLGGKFADPFRDLYDALDTDTVKSFGYGTFPKIVVETSDIVQDKTSLGSWVVVELQSMNARWVVTPNVDDDEAKKLLRYSYNGRTIDDGSEDDGKTLEAYRQELVEQSYDKADIKEYLDMWVMVDESEKGGVVQVANKELVQVQIAPQSLKQWKKYSTNAGLRSARGTEASAKVRLTANRGEFGGKKFGYFTFSAA